MPLSLTTRALLILASLNLLDYLDRCQVFPGLLGVFRPAIYLKFVKDNTELRSG